LLAMNRLRRAYLKMAPALEPYFSTGHHDDEQGLAASYLLAGRGGPRLWRWGQFLVNTPTIVATLDAALAAAIVVLVVRAAEAATVVAVVAGAVAFLVVWAALFLLQRRAWTRCGVRRRGSPRRQMKPERLAGSSASLQPMERSLPLWPRRSWQPRQANTRTLLGVVVALSSGRLCFDFKVGSPGAGDDSSPSFCDSPNEPAGPGDAATHGG
jgi:hypothetical protein